MQCTPTNQSKRTFLTNQEKIKTNLGLAYARFSRAWHRLRVFPKLAPVTWLPSLGIICMFSRDWHLIALFSRVLRRLHGFPRLISAAFL